MASINTTDAINKYLFRMDTLRLQNYRCFRDTGNIPLKKVNLLVGANSTGKSSFLKFFPLLKQSINIGLNGVFRWLGNDVDFKDFFNTVHDGQDSITIDYTVKSLRMYQKYFNNRLPIEDLFVSFTIIPVKIHFDMISVLKVRYLETDIDIVFKDGGRAEVIANGVSTTVTKDLIVRWQNTEAIFPRLLFSTNDKYNHGFTTSPSVYLKNIMSEVNEMLNRNRIYNRYLIFERFPSSYANFSKGIDGICKEEIEESKKRRLYTLCLLYNINMLIDALNINLVRLSSHIQYIKPVRATIERYYRFQNLDMDEIDADGANLPMYLYNLEQEDGKMEAFNDWLMTHFSFRVKIKPSDGHIELLVSEDGKPFRNTVDLGFGYTQLLPILAVVWKTVFLDVDEPTPKNTVPEEHIIVIEQPELHLHPRFQGKFVEMLSIISRIGHERQFDVRFIIETHSDIILNELGTYIESGILYSDDVNILMLEQDDIGESRIKSTYYNEQGFIEEWPRNFLEDAYTD